MSGAASGIRLVAALLASALAAAAQQESELIAAFDAAQRAVATAPRAQHAALCRRASDAFLRLPPGAARQQRLASAARLTLAGGRHEIALELAEEPAVRATAEGALVRLQALARLARFAPFCDALLETLPVHAQTARVALRSEEGRLLPLAARQLRTDDPTQGKFVFQMLARLEPVQSYRLANAALCLRQLGDIEGAFRLYEQARKVAPTDVPLLNDYGLLLRSVGRHREAIEMFRKGVEYDLQLPEPQRGRGPAITNLVFDEVIAPGSISVMGAAFGANSDQELLPIALDALRRRPDARMLRRLTLDLQLDRLQARGAVARRPQDR